MAAIVIKRLARPGRGMATRGAPVMARLLSTTPSSAAPRLTVSPAHCMFDEPVSIVASGLRPGQGYTLGSSVTDSKGVPFTARAHYTADDHGVIDTARHPAIGGHYSGLHPMGLVANLRPDRSSKYSHYRFSFKDVTTPPSFDINLYEGYGVAHQLMHHCEPPVVSSATHTRRLMAPGVRRIPVREGRVRGVLYLPPGPGPHPGVLDLFGTAGGCLQHRSALLASRGVASLALAFFDYEDLPKKIEEFDIEYFEEAAEYLASRPEVAGDGVGAVGVSKGGDLVLSMAAYVEKVKASVVINGCVSNLEAKFRLHNGESIPPLRFNLGKITLMTNGALDTVDFIEDPLDHPETLLPVELIPGHVLWVVGEDDRNMHSGRFADIALSRCEGVNDRLEVVRYPGAGHLIEPPFVPFCEMSYHKVIGRAMLWGGDAKAHCDAQVDSWERILSFFKEKLGGEDSEERPLKAKL